MTSAALDDPQQGLAELDRTDVLIWWGHVRQMEIEPPVASNIVRRIQEGRLSLIALHSAHWSRPFVEAMNVLNFNLFYFGVKAFTHHSF